MPTMAHLRVLWQEDEVFNAIFKPIPEPLFNPFLLKIAPGFIIPLGSRAALIARIATQLDRVGIALKIVNFQAPNTVFGTD